MIKKGRNKRIVKPKGNQVDKKTKHPVIYRPKSRAAQEIMIEFSNQSTPLSTNSCIVVPFSLHLNKFKIDKTDFFNDHRRKNSISLHDTQLIIDHLRNTSFFYDIKRLGKRRKRVICKSVLFFFLLLISLFLILGLLRAVIHPSILLVFWVVMFIVYLIFVHCTFNNLENKFFVNREEDFNRQLAAIDRSKLSSRGLMIKVGKFGSYLTIKYQEEEERTAFVLETEQKAINAVEKI